MFVWNMYHFHIFKYFHFGLHELDVFLKVFLPDLVFASNLGGNELGVSAYFDHPRSHVYSNPMAN